MAGARSARLESGDSPDDLFHRIGAFLRDQRLDPDPANYAFVHHLLTHPESAVARTVNALTDGGVRLTQRDIETLDTDLRPIHSKVQRERAEGLVARTQIQVEGFQDMVNAMRDETAGFGRDLAASAAAISQSAEAGTDPDMVDEIARITAAMLTRVHTTEARLESATREASELRKKLEEARDNARRDPLTDLPNRRAFEEAYAARADLGEQLCIAICDVDHFKSVNDRFGHSVGDRVLKAIGEALSQTCVGHLVARYGGEEFAILFAATELDIARDTLERARTAVATKRYRLRENDVPLGEITFSAGLTAAAQHEAYQSAFQRADRLLYSAKNAGRNCLQIG